MGVIRLDMDFYRRFAGRIVMWWMTGTVTSQAPYGDGAKLAWEGYA